MQNIVWKVLLVFIVLGFCGLGLYYKPIRLGKDLQGGVSLIYSVNIPEGTQSDDVLLQVINTLKDRVNPSGVLDISMQPLGSNRIEVVMPLPNENVIALRDLFETALKQVLEDAEINPGDLDTAIRAGTAPEQFCIDEESPRCANVRDLQRTWNEILDKEAALDAANAGETDEQAVFALEQDLANLDAEYERLRTEVLRLSLDEVRVRRMLTLDTQPRVVKDATGEKIIDETTGEFKTSPSIRQEAVNQITSEFPELSDELDDLIEKFDTYQENRTGLDDPEDLKRLMRGAGVLEFRITVSNTSAADEGVDITTLRQELNEVGPQNTTSPIARWFPIHDLKQWYSTPEQLLILEANPEAFFAQRDFVASVRDGVYYMLVFDVEGKKMTHGGDREWSIERAGRTRDDFGRPAVSFRLDAVGGQLMSRLTGPHVNQPMAIMLDGRVYSAPNLNSAIGNQGVIQGQFSDADISYLIRVLAAGALSARLSPDPIAEITLGPSLGQDNLKRGREAFIIAIIAVAIFMVLYYFFAGFVADLALAANGLIIFGFMAWIDGTFTLPGLAGIVLTIGMAVDANVLIYERIREELFSGEYDLKSAVRQGYAKALSTIIDGNITNLIVCFVLAKTATTEVKGFAITLAIGICATLFTALFMTRQIFTLAVELGGMRKLPMLPTVFPAIHRALEPKIKWTKLAPAFWVISGILVVGSIALVASRGVNMLDTELRGGVSATMNTVLLNPEDPNSTERVKLPLLEVRDRVQSLADGASTAEDAELTDQVRVEFAKATVLTVGDADNVDGDIQSSSFQIKVASPPGIDEEDDITSIVVDLLVQEFGDQLDIAPPLDFEGAPQENNGNVQITNAAQFVRPIDQDNLGSVVGLSSFNVRSPDYRGGVAMVINDVTPPTTVEDIKRRIANLRTQPDFQDNAGRDFAVYGVDVVEGSGDQAKYDIFVITVRDANLSSLRVDSDVWYNRLAAPEWALVSTALAQPTSLDQVSSYSSAVAQTLKAQATVAVILTLLGILVYIWARFGSFRYSLAAIVALGHDVSIALGLLAVTAIIGNTAFGNALLIEEFRIDLGVVAALLTIIGYSLNDTIVILDRIRENRGKRPTASPEIVDRSINQTVSRTLLTSFTTLMAVAIMYFEGGSGIRPFAYTLLIGLVVGTYSSVAIAAPLVVRRGNGAAPESAAALPTEPMPETP